VTPLKMLAAGLALAALAAGLARAQPAPAPAQPNQPAAAPGEPAPPTAVPTFRQPSGANLNISPKRIVLDRNRRAGAIFVFNQGSAAGTFDIVLVDRVMLLDGQILAVADAQADPAAKAIAERVKSAKGVLQVSPRRITLAPGQGQTIRLRVAGAPEDASAVELRSHLTISSLPPRESGVTAEEAAAATRPGELRIQINALLGLSIPAIVRMTDPDVRATVENPKVTALRLGGPKAPPSPVLSLDLVRQGANSLFGNVEVRVAGQPKSQPIGIARGVGVYTEIDRRTIQIPLARAPQPGERLEVTFTDDDSAPGKLLAKLDF
jgi:hypothetical protein